MGRVNAIQGAIIGLGGGSFQSLVDEYLYKKYGYKNIQTLGVQTATNKPTKGTPDTYVFTDEGKYILINYGSVESNTVEKIRKDILSCFDKSKLNIEKENIEKIICVHTSTNIHIEQYDLLKHCIDGVQIELIGIDTISHDLADYYPMIAKDHLGIAIDTAQIFDVEDFILKSDSNCISSPLSVNFYFREAELENIISSVEEYDITCITGASGIGKTKLTLAACECLESNGWDCLCIKSNGQALYEDLRYYFQDNKDYVLFFDDANNFVSFENILQYISSVKNVRNIRIILTVRDYAKRRVISSCNKFFSTNIIDVNTLDDKEIKEILRKNLNIQNIRYLDRIVAVAKGNIRLAMLAGMKSVEKGLLAINNAEDIFKNYYGDVIEKSRLGESDIKVLFIIAFLGPINYKENALFKDYCSYFRLSDSIDLIIENLYSLELIDWFKDEIVKIEDQSFSNYILYAMLIKKRWITVSDLLKMCFPRYKNKLIYAFNTFLQLFGGKENIEYFESEINKIWAEYEESIEFIGAFYSVNPEKALIYIKKRIEKMDITEYTVSEEDEKKLNNVSVNTPELSILMRFKYTNCMVDAIDLIYLYFEKHPDLFAEIYKTIEEGYLFDKDSYYSKYLQERSLFRILWEKTDAGDNKNNTYIFLWLARKALRCEVSYTEATGKKINFCRMSLVPTEELLGFRREIYAKLGELYLKPQYKNVVLSILSNKSIRGIYEDSAMIFLKNDFDCVKEIIDGKDGYSFKEAVILADYEHFAATMELNLMDIQGVKEKCKAFDIYELLTREYVKGGSFVDDERIRNEEIHKVISKFNENDFSDFFLSLSNLNDECTEDDWNISSGVAAVFNIIKELPVNFIVVFKSYLEAGAPYGHQLSGIISYLIINFGYDNTKSLLESVEYRDKLWWLSRLWLEIPEKYIDEKIYNDYSMFLQNRPFKDCNVVPSIIELRKYVQVNKELVIDVAKKLINEREPVFYFLRGLIDEKKVEAIDEIFKDDFNVFEELYFLGIGNHIDYKGNIFWYIYDRDKTVWGKYLACVKKLRRETCYEHEIIEKAWDREEYNQLINNAVDELLSDSFGIRDEEWAGVIFGKSKNEPEELLQRKRNWFFDRVNKDVNCIDSVNQALSLIGYAYPEWKKDLILEFARNNKEVDAFKKLYIFPLSYSWTGSEIPIIDKRIDYLKTLKEELKGIEYIEHRNYLNERIQNLRDKKEFVEKREYLEDLDFA